MLCVRPLLLLGEPTRPRSSESQCSDRRVDVGGGKAKRSGVRWGEPSGAKGSNVVPSDLLPTRTLAFVLSVLCVRLPVGASWQLFLAGRLLSRECVPSAGKQCGRPTQFSRAQPNQRHECNLPHATSCCRGSCSSCCTAATSCLSFSHSLSCAFLLSPFKAQIRDSTRWQPCQLALIAHF